MASYVLRRRYGPARHVITVASWVTVISMVLQPVAVLAAGFSSVQTGDYNANATWGGAANPGGGAGNDTVAVNGTHTVTITLANDASTDAVTVNAGGTLTAKGAAAVPPNYLAGSTVNLAGGGGGGYKLGGGDGGLGGGGGGGAYGGYTVGAGDKTYGLNPAGDGANTPGTYGGPGDGGNRGEYATMALLDLAELWEPAKP